jgi:hypothetical protein
MNLAEYFENTKGTGILATADKKGNVDIAIYARPHIIDEKTIAFIMNERLSYKNLTSNPKAAYLFLEKKAGYKGRRLYLTKTRAETDVELIEFLRSRKTDRHHARDTKKYLVYFSVHMIRPLVGE